MLKKPQQKNKTAITFTSLCPFVSVLSLLYQTLAPAHDRIFMKDTDLLDSILERPTALLCQTTNKSNL